LLTKDPSPFSCNATWAEKYQATNKQEQAMPFIKGKSGNPRGRPLGARGQRTLAREAALLAEADAKARAIIYGSRGVHGGRSSTRPPRAANPPARLPEDMVPHDTQTTAALVGALLGIDAATVMEEVGLSGHEADDWFDDVL
jgi:hypothetical protein